MTQRRTVRSVPLTDPETTEKLTKLADEINAADAKFKELQASAIDRAIEAGEKLLEVQALLGRGTFVDWVRANCHFALSSAYLYRSIALNLRAVPALRPKLNGLLLMEADRFLKYAIETREHRDEKDREADKHIAVAYLAKAAVLLLRVQLTDADALDLWLAENQIDRKVVAWLIDKWGKPNEGAQHLERPISPDEASVRGYESVLEDGEVSNDWKNQAAAEWERDLEREEERERVKNEAAAKIRERAAQLREQDRLKPEVG
jgi:hypothetical protein